MNIRWIDFDRIEVYEAGALLVTLLAYPRGVRGRDRRVPGVGSGPRGA
jgi:hypothetical protein